MTSPSPAYRRLALWTAAATFLLIVLGGVVRVSDSGLGCGPAESGFHGWPLCNGDVVPGASLNTAVEYAHRAVASTVGVLLFAVALLAWRRYREHRQLVRAAFAAAALVVVEGVLGAATVEKNLDEPLVAVHLGVAMLIFAIVLYAWWVSRPGPAAAAPADGGPRFRALAIGAQALLFATIVSGGYMAGTQHYGRADYQLGDGAHHACGREFPTCNDGFMPFGDSRLVDIHLTHRAFMYLASIALIALVVVALRRRPSPRLVRAAQALGALLVVQILLGALNVWLEEYELLILAHLTVATLLWAAASMLTYQLYPVRAPAPARTRLVTA